MSQTQNIGESLHAEVDLTPTLNERALKAIGRPLTQEEIDRLYAKVQKPSDDIKGPFVCLVCAHSSSTGWVIKNHIGTHTLEKPFQCTFCSKKFTQKGDRDRHIQTHTENQNDSSGNREGDELYECQFCFKTFQNVDQLRSHDLEHSSSVNFFDCEDHLDPTDPSTSETSIAAIATTEEITIEEHKLEPPDEPNETDPVASI